MTPAGATPLGVILAGGKSSRMGRDKAWLTFFGQPLVLEYRSGLIDKSNKHKNRQSAVEMPKNTGLLFLAGCQGFGGPERCNCRLRSSVARTNAALQP